MSQTPLESNANNLVRNLVIAIAAIVLSIALFLGLQTDSSSLESQAKNSIPP